MMSGDAGITTSSPANPLLPHCRSILRSCALGQRPPSHAHQLHAALLKAAILFLDSPISSALFHMYAACGSPASAIRAFEGIPPPSRSTTDWTALISCHNTHGLPARALTLFRSMRRAGPPPDEVTLIALLSAAARLADPAAGAAAHHLFLKLGLSFPTRARNAAMDVYAKCGRMDDARCLFNEMPAPTVVSWTIILVGTLRWEGFGSGREMFDRMPQRNEVSWATMIAACVEAGLPRDAMSLLARVLFDDASTTSLNHVGMCSLLCACSQAGDLVVGRWVHSHVLKVAKLQDQHLLMVHTTLVDMYGKCGRIDTAHLLFESMQHRNVVAWNAMLSVLSMHGLGFEVIRMFTRMVEVEEQSPDDITFVSVLSACSRSGLLEQGRRFFNDLSPVYGLTPKVEHYACMVDLLGRAGLLEEAEALIREMPVYPNEVVLGSLLASCALHGKLDLGRRMMQELVRMDTQNTEYHVLLSNLYTSSGRHAEANDLREALKMSGVRKTPGSSFIEIDGIVHWFCAGDKSHPRAREVYAMLDEMVRRLRLAGYIPDAASQISGACDRYLENGDEWEEREQALLSHSERLAIALGLISTRPGVPLRIFKNLRICSDCHSAVKFVSDIFNREIIIRDRNRFHSFKKGVCSCSDYW